MVHGIINKIMSIIILNFFVEFVQSKHRVARAALVDAINDKCANCRRVRGDKKEQK